MRQSQLFYKTLKRAPKDEESINSQLLIRAGFIYKEMAGVWSFLPLGLRVLRKIEKIIREEMEKIGAQEILMSVLQPRFLWEETGRWSKEIGKVMYKTQEGKKETGLGPTHEEMITDIVRKSIKSWQDLPLYLYQIQNKFRKEPRAKSGLLRCREFGMKDLYSFHSSEEDFRKYYDTVKKAYFRIFKRCGLDSILTEASGAGFTKEITHEFQVLADGGEDRIIYCPKHHFSQNKEIAKLKTGDKCPICQRVLKEEKSIEAGNIFPLETKFSKQMSAFFTDRDGKKKLIVMGCYGLGVSRIIGVIVEVHHDQFGIIWPKEVAPFQIHLIPIELSSPRVGKDSEKLYRDLQKENLEILYDDRKNVFPGEKLVEADLIGLPIRIVISERTLKRDCVEVKERKKKEVKLVKRGHLLQFLKSNIKLNYV